MAALVLAAAAAQQSLLALGVIGFGSHGEQPPGAALLQAAVAVMLVSGAGLLVATARPPAWQWIAALPLLAAAVVLARYGSPDPYFLAEGTRIADGGTVSARPILAVALLAVLAAATARRLPRLASGLAAATVWTSAAVVTLEGFGH